MTAANQSSRNDEVRRRRKRAALSPAGAIAAPKNMRRRAAAGADGGLFEISLGLMVARRSSRAACGPPTASKPSGAAAGRLTFHRKVMAETPASLVRLDKIPPPDETFFAMTETPLR
jgi:hypothetical protein